MKKKKLEKRIKELEERIEDLEDSLYVHTHLSHAKEVIPYRIDPYVLPVFESLPQYSFPEDSHFCVCGA